MKIKETIIIFIMFVGLLISSEFVYFSNNKHSLVILYLNYARSSADNRNPKQALKYLGKAGELKLKEIALKHPDTTIHTSIVTPPILNNSELNQIYANILQDFSYNIQSSPSEWANLYYNLGLIAYKKNIIHLTAPFWQIAINFVPEWSHFHLELANFYLAQGNNEKAISVIEYCQEFSYPKKHCNQFMQENIQTNSPEEIGSWKKEISDI